MHVFIKYSWLYSIFPAQTFLFQLDRREDATALALLYPRPQEPEVEPEVTGGQYADLPAEPTPEAVVKERGECGVEPNPAAIDKKQSKDQDGEQRRQFAKLFEKYDFWV